MEDEEGTPSRRSARRGTSSAKQNQKDALEKLKKTRMSGKAYKPDVDVPNVYEEVDDDTYNDIVRERQNDFVVDDDGSGYIDHGADLLDDDYEDFDENVYKEKKAKKKKEAPKKGAINSFFSAAPAPKTKIDESQVKLDTEDDALKDALAMINDDVLDVDYHPPVILNRIENSNPFRSKRPAIEDNQDVLAPSPLNKKIRLTAPRPPKMEAKTISKPKPASPVKVQIKNEPMDDDFDAGGIDDDYYEPAPSQTNEDGSKLKMEVDEPEPSRRKIEMSFSEADWNSEEAPEEKIEVVAGSEEFYIKENDEQKIRMYFLDAYEDHIKHAGTIYLFGRVFTNNQASASCAVILTNVQRQIYFLPKEMCADKDVYEEIKAVLHREVGVTNFKCKKTNKKFMNDGTLNEGEHQKEVAVFEIRYDSKHPPLKRDLTGKTFEAVFNTTTTAMERLLVETELMGPGWTDISNYTEVHAKRTYCDYEFTVDMERMKNVVYNQKINIAESVHLPFARMLALNVITSLNSGNNEICMISALYNPKCDLNNPSIERKYLQRFCVISKASGVSVPFDLENHLNRANLKDLVKIVPNENQLISLFLAKMQKWEPDIIVGHDVAAIVDLLKARIQKLNVVKWDRISRLKRSVAISTIKNNKAGHWELTAGRLLVDSRLLSMELVRSRNYDLTELASLLLNTTRKEIYANEIVSFYGRSDRMMDLIQWSWEDPYISLQIIVHLNALPLVLQITNIVGGITSRTLMGGRAERNEYLLLHAFNKSNVIAPNKYQPHFAKNDHKKPVKKEDDPQKEGGPEEEPVIVDDTTVDDTAGKNKAQYSGGLVLEPKKGLYDTLILLLDFNSLYPSIIQEFNICFTTVKHTKDSNDLPEVPESCLSEGVLPREIRVLVQRRRQVKSMMNEKGIPESKRKQLDIRQTALKLTANSMYGCLGFQQSRFYAKPLAALITAKGREILMHSKNLVEKLGYTVIYGDTDSIMINTNSTDLAQAKKLGGEIKREVNKCHKLLELDLDGVFKRMLLLKKKKYAALIVNPGDESDTKKELKGLDIVRRDWSLLAKHSGTEIVDLILNPALSREELVSEIVDSLKKLRKMLDNNDFDQKMFEISKQLTRNPKEYKDLKAQPHATVAARLNESGKFTLKHGDVVEYIICDDGTSNPAIQRAYHHTELAERKDLKIDVHYYLAQQVHPVVARLCAPIEEADAVLIAESLGLDSTTYRRSAVAHAAKEATEENEVAWSGPITYDHCDDLQFPCPKCKSTVRIRSCLEGEDNDIHFAFSKCEKCECALYEAASFITQQVETALFNYVRKHLSSVFKCDEPVCDYETASHPMTWCREGLECPRCTGGILRKTYTAKDLFDQQSFYKIIADYEAALKKVTPEQRKRLEHFPDFSQIKKLCSKLLKIIEKYLCQNAYNRVDLAYLFAPMLKI